MAFGITEVTLSSTPLSGVTGLKVVSSKKTPRAESVADALDENGDVAARTVYGGDADVVQCEATMVFVGSGGAALSASVTLGNATASSGSVTKWVQSVKVETSNGDFPQITVTWWEGLPNVSGSAFTVSLPAIYPRKTAQSLGVSATEGLLNGTSATWQCSMTEALDDSGELAAVGFSNGTAECSADAVAADDAPEFSAATGWTLVEAGGLTESNTAYATASATATKFLEADGD